MMKVDGRGEGGVGAGGASIYALLPCMKQGREGVRDCAVRSQEVAMRGGWDLCPLPFAWALGRENGQL